MLDYWYVLFVDTTLVLCEVESDAHHPKSPTFVSLHDIFFPVLGQYVFFFLYLRYDLLVFVSSIFLQRTHEYNPLWYLSYSWIVNTGINQGKWGLQWFKCCSGLFCNLLDVSLFNSWNNFWRLISTFQCFIHRIFTLWFCLSRKLTKVFVIFAEWCPNISDTLFLLSYWIS